VVTASSVPEALQLAGDLSPDLILSDIQKPGLNGYDLVRAVKADQRLHPIPVILISSSSPGTVDLGCSPELGADALINQPIDPTRLVAELEAYLLIHK
jgi:CheY-like chemotaxis protein